MTRDEALKRFVEEFSIPYSGEENLGPIELTLNSVGLFTYASSFDDNNIFEIDIDGKYFKTLEEGFEKLEKWYEAIGKVLGKEEL